MSVSVEGNKQNISDIFAYSRYEHGLSELQLQLIWVTTLFVSSSVSTVLFRCLVIVY